MQTKTSSQAGERTQEIQWDCTSGIYETAPTPTVIADIPREVAMRNLPTNDEGENFYGEMMEDVARLEQIRRGDDAGMKSEIESNPWLSRAAIIAGLERSETTLRRAGFKL